MKIFLLGHRGFIGSHLLPALQRAGHQVETNWIYFEQKYDVIINLAAVTHIRNEFDPQMIESNIILADKVFQREERIVYASSCSAKHFTNPYAWTKMFMEYRGEKHGNAIGLRFHNVYGPGNNKGIVWYLMQQPDGAKVELRGPDTIRDYIFVEDVIKKILGALPKKINVSPYVRRCPIIPQANIGVVDVGTGIGTSTMDLVNLYQEISGKQFHLTISSAGDNEPSSMIANVAAQFHTTLREGLIKTIKSL